MATVLGLVGFALLEGSGNQELPPYAQEIGTAAVALAVIFGLAFLGQLMASGSAFAYRAVRLQWAVLLGLLAFGGWALFQHFYQPISLLAQSGKAEMGIVERVSTTRHRARGIPYKTKRSLVTYPGGRIQLGGDWGRGTNVPLLVLPTDSSVASPGLPGDSTLTLFRKRFGFFIALLLPLIGPGLGLAALGLFGAVIRGPIEQSLAKQTGQPGAISTLQCSSCAKSIPGDSKFCPHCGAQAGVRACPKCKAPLGPGHKFCKECGEAIGAKPPGPANPTRTETPERAPEPYRFKKSDNKLAKVSKLHGIPRPPAKVLQVVMIALTGFVLGFVVYFLGHDSDPVLFTPNEAQVDKEFEF